MLCPVCEVELRMSERKGIEIDYCPQCRGVWLDRGELDKIIERTNKDLDKTNKHKPSYRSEYHHPNEPYEKRKRDYKYKKRKSVLGEIFDIFD